MSLRDRKIDPSRRHRNYRITEILADLDPEDAGVLIEWVNDVRYSPEKISDELRAEGYVCSPSSIARYRYEVLGIGERKR